jgi:hypothetical protein
VDALRNRTLKRPQRFLKLDSQKSRILGTAGGEKNAAPPCILVLFILLSPFMAAILQAPKTGVCSFVNTFVIWSRILAACEGWGKAGPGRPFGDIMRGDPPMVNIEQLGG